MKKLFYVGALTALLLVGCGEEQTASKDTSGTTNEESKKTTNEGGETKEGAESAVKSGEVKNGPLTEAGQWTMSGEDKVTLIKIKEVNQTYKQGPVNLKIESVKLLHHSNVASETKEYIKNLHGKDLTELNTIQISYSMENTSDENVMMMAIDTLTTDTKVQIHGYDTMAIDDDTGSYSGQVIVDGLAIFPYFTGSLEDINKVFINTGMAFNTDTGTTLGDSQRIEITF